MKSPKLSEVISEENPDFHDNYFFNFSNYNGSPLRDEEKNLRNPYI